MQSNLNALASKLNEMKNPQRIGVCVGEVTQVEDGKITVSIAGGSVRLSQGEELTLTETVKNKSPQKGDKVLVIPSENEQKWVAVDKISED